MILQKDVLTLDEMCDAHGVADIWNRRAREAGFVTSYDTGRVRGRATDPYGHLPRIPKEELPPALQSVRSINWFRKRDAERVYLRPESNRYSVASPEATGLCPRCGEAFTEARNRPGRKSKPDIPFTPWYWCARCRTNHQREWRVYYHEHGPNAHLPYREFFPADLYEGIKQNGETKTGASTHLRDRG